MALWRDIKRISRYGLIGFFRNGFVSLAAILIMTITLFVIAVLIIGSAALQATLAGISEKVDVNVYFVTNAPEERILDLQKALEAIPEVAEVSYTTREQAIERFRERHKNDQLTLQALEELGDNPLGASLAIRARETSQYESIAKFLESSPAGGTGGERIIEKVNFFQNKAAIDRLTDIINTSRSLGLAVSIFLGIASVLIAFNTIRLAIYTSRDEIGVMKIVGAEHWYVRGPFVISGILYGAMSGILVLLVLYPISLYLATPSERFFGGHFDTLSYFTEHFPLLFLNVVGIGILLGAISSYMAVHRYLKH